MIDRTRADVLGPPRPTSGDEDIRQLLSAWPAELPLQGSSDESEQAEASA